MSAVLETAMARYTVPIKRDIHLLPMVAHTVLQFHPTFHHSPTIFSTMHISKDTLVDTTGLDIKAKGKGAYFPTCLKGFAQYILFFASLFFSLSVFFILEGLS